MRKMNTKKAREILALSGEFTLAILKKQYKTLLLTTHPDKGGCTEDTKELNAAFEALKPLAVPTISETAEDTVCMESDINSHPLYNSRVPSVSSFETLLNETFDFLDEIPSVSKAYSHKCYSKRGGTFFRGDDNRDWNYWVDSIDSTISIYNITDGGRIGKTIPNVFLRASCYPSDLCDSMKNPWNILNPWFSKTKSRDLYEITLPELSDWLYVWAEACDAKPREWIQMDGAQFKLQSAYTDTSTYTIKPETGGVLTFTVCKGNKANGTINPFTLQEVMKPLTKMPSKSEPSIKELVRILVNGQFAQIKCNFYHTDDYRLDASRNFLKGYLDNPLKKAVDWFGERKISCTRLYMSGNKLSFGQHSNESYSLEIELSNRYPSVDIDTEVKSLESALEEQLLLTA
ncbi:hypothetical protein AB4571_02685 [Vibrio breoganii]|uniref:hypothetical protein n=1 Tax=Vibrio breoganii TaxID=553239 RepID=UPI000C842AF3|nr:hypothetical protein [Vibrio breoganii]PML13956.1 hypothetical protein BCT84_12410 [Vibrio breoganii]